MIIKQSPEHDSIMFYSDYCNVSYHAITSHRCCNALTGYWSAPGAEELLILIIGALYQLPRVLGIIKSRKLDGEVGPLWAFGGLLSVYRHNKVFDVEAGTLNPAEVHHGTPPL